MESRWLLVRAGLVWRLFAAEAVLGEWRGCWYILWEASDRPGRGRAGGCVGSDTVWGGYRGGGCRLVLMGAITSAAERGYNPSVACIFQQTDPRGRGVLLAGALSGNSHDVGSSTGCGVRVDGCGAWRGDKVLRLRTLLMGLAARLSGRRVRGQCRMRPDRQLV